MATTQDLDYFGDLGCSACPCHLDYAGFVVPSEWRFHPELRQSSRDFVFANFPHRKLADICHPRRPDLAILATVRHIPLKWQSESKDAIANIYCDSLSRVGAIFGVDVIATLFCVFGWLSGPSYETTPRGRADFQDNGRTSIVTAIVIWGYSIAVTIVIAIVYYLMNRISWLDNLGRKSRSRSDTNVENIISSLVGSPYLNLLVFILQGGFIGIYIHS